MWVGKRGGERRRASATLEMAFILMPLMMTFMGVIEYSRYLFVRGLADNACREGARFAIVHATDRTTADVQAQVTSKLAGQSSAFSGLVINVYKIDPATGTNQGAWTNARFGDGIAVQIVGNYVPMIPLVNKNSVTISTTAVMLCEAN
ncbi:MAG: TadE/TadG family type IV pilus assembly protein [Isosphaeraceae bacterium]